MKYERFEELPVWQLSRDVAAKMFRWVTAPPFRGMGDLANQLQRAALSISNNIAEGFERGSTSELLQYLYIARGSAGEVRSMLEVMKSMQEFSVLQREIEVFHTDCESISRQLRGWAASLQNSDIEGQRHLNDQTRRKHGIRQRVRAASEQIERTMDGIRSRLEQEREERGRQMEIGDE